MLFAEPLRVGYVVKRYPRYSETFIVAEILSHEAAGLAIEIFSLSPPADGHFQDAIAWVKAPVNYLPYKDLSGSDFWEAVQSASEELPEFSAALEGARGEKARDVFHAVWLARQARRKNIRHLHAHFASVSTTVARLAARFAGLPYSFTAHAKDIYHESARYDDLYRKLSDAAAVVTVSDFNLAYLRETYGPAAARVTRIYNGLDLGLFSYEAPHDRPARIVAVGRLVEKKGFADLIDACAVLARRGSQFTCQIIGTGEMETALRAQIEQAGLQARVELLGPRPQSEVINLVRGAAVFAAPCVVGGDGNRDGLPTVLLEAMALGTPCISTYVTGIPEVIRDGETGLLVPQRDPLALAAAIERLLVNPTLSVQIAERARHLIQEEFNIVRNTARLRAVFEGAGVVAAVAH